MILRVIPLISIIRIVITLLIDVRMSSPSIIIVKLTRLKLKSGIDVIIAHIFRLVMVLDIVLLVLFLS